MGVIRRLSDTEVITNTEDIPEEDAEGDIMRHAVI
jgi:hypothetical protein